jgi:hypothetical protein
MYEITQSEGGQICRADQACLIQLAFRALVVAVPMPYLFLNF